MAVSPLPIRSPAKGATVNAATARSLAVRGAAAAINAPALNGSPQTQNGSLDLSEQQNEEERRKYVKDRQVGEGTYATVFLGHMKDDPKTIVAIKKFKKNADFKDGLSVDSIREIKYLQELSHPNIITLYSVFSSRDQNLNMVLEFLPLGDLEMLIKDIEHVAYAAADIKAWMGMLCRAVWFCHANFVLHRDIKPNNLLIAADGEMKLADFGLARSFAEPYTNMTHNVITIWYRPPELLFGARQYSGAVDVWSMGMVFAELVLRRAYCQGETDISQLERISENVGTATEENWPGVSKLPNFVPFEKEHFHPVKGRDYYLRNFGTQGNEGVELLMSMLMLDPRKRKTARQILEHKWWTVDPRPTNKEDLPKKGGGLEKMGSDLQRRPGELDDKAKDKVARKLDFSKR